MEDVEVHPPDPWGGGWDPERDPAILVHGANGYIDDQGDIHGLDTLAACIAKNLGWPVDAFPVPQAAWKKVGRAAGPMRNQTMVDTGPKLCLAFPLPKGSIGTWDCIKRAVAAGIPKVAVRIFPLEGT